MREEYRIERTKEKWLDYIHLLASVTVGTVRGQQEGSQYSRVSDTEGWR